MGVLEYTTEEIERPVRRPAIAIANEIAARHGVNVRKMRGPSRERHLVAARIDLYLALRAQDWGYKAIGEFVGRHHTTIVKLLNKHQERADKANEVFTRL